MKALLKKIIFLVWIILPCLALAQEKQNTGKSDLSPDLKLSIAGDRMVPLRRSPVYKIILRNDGEASAKAVELRQTLPPNL